MSRTTRPMGRTTLAFVAVLLIAAAGVANFTPAQNEPTGPVLTEASPAQAQGWEYKAIPRAEIIELAPGQQGEYILPKDLLDDFNAGLTILGDQGWQLVAVEPYHKEGYVSWPALYVFRRPK